MIISRGTAIKYTKSPSPQIKMKVKEWNRYPEFDKELMLKQYDVILTDHKTKKEKTISILKKFNLKNLDKGLKKFDESMKKFDKGMEKGLGKNKQNKIDLIWGSKPKKSRSGKSKKQKQSNPVDKIWGKPSNNVSKIYGKRISKVKVF